MSIRRAFLLALSSVALAQSDKPLPVPEEEIRRIVREVSDLARAEEPAWGAETLFRLARVLHRDYPQLAASVRADSQKLAANIPSAITRASYTAMLLTDDKSPTITAEQVIGACLSIPQDDTGSSAPALTCLCAAYESYRNNNDPARELVFLRAGISLGRVSSFPVSDILRRRPPNEATRFLHEYVTRLNPDDAPSPEIQTALALAEHYPSTRKELLPALLRKLARAIPNLPETPPSTLTVGEETLQFESPRALHGYQLRRLASLSKLQEVIEQLPETPEPESKQPLDKLTLENWLAAKAAIPDPVRDAAARELDAATRFLDTAAGESVPEAINTLPFPDVFDKIDAEPSADLRLAYLCSISRRQGDPQNKREVVRRADEASAANPNPLIRSSAYFFLAGAVVESELERTIAEDFFRRGLATYLSFANPILKGEAPYYTNFPENYDELTSLLWFFVGASQEFHLPSDHLAIRARVSILALQSRLGGSSSFFSLAP